MFAYAYLNLFKRIPLNVYVIAFICKTFIYKIVVGLHRGKGVNIDKENCSERLYKQGNEFYEKGEWRTAIWYYDQSIELDPANYKAYYNRALAKACMENYDDALKDLEKVVELKENFAETYYLRGLCYEYKGVLNEAIKEYNEALSRNPDFRDAQNRKESCENKVQKNNKTNSFETIEDAKTLEKEGKYNEALDLLEKALKQQPDSFQLLYYRRRLLEKVEAPFIHEICGLEELKELFKRLVVYPLRHSQHPVYKSVIAKTSKGILLYGPPGCGKTMFTKNLAREEGIDLCEIVLSDVLNLYVGESEKRLTEAFNKAKEVARGGKPVILFIDEVDALGFSRTLAREATESYFSQSLIATFLRLFNELEEIPNLIIVGATNRPWTVDDALRRPGRLGSAIAYCPPPDEKTREELFRLYAKDTPGYERLDFKKLAGATKWFSGDDIRCVCRDVHFQIAKETIDKHCNVHAKTEDYLKCTATKTPQVKCWLRLVAKTHQEGKIEEYEMDERLKKDISDFCKSELVIHDEPQMLENKYVT